MKKLLLILPFLIHLSAYSQTSVYHPFPDSNAVWNYNFTLNCIMGYADENYSITFSRDTLINSQVYHVISTPYVQSFSTGSCLDIYPGYKGALRQDTANRKVFFVPPADSSEVLLYDFNMLTGDTVQGYLKTIIFGEDIVISIDSVLVGNSYRKRWNIDNCYGVRLIEGVGCTYGLIEHLPGCVTDQADYSLTCFQQNNQSLYPDTSINCELITYIKSEVRNRKPEILISPNPFHSTATLHLNPSFSKAELKIYNLFGKEVKRQKLTAQTAVINRDGMADGIYFFRVSSEEGEWVGKIVVE